MKLQKKLPKWLNNHKSKILIITLYVLLALGVCLIYPLKENKIGLIIDGVLTIIIFMALTLISIKNKGVSRVKQKEETLNNFKILKKFVNNSEFLINDQNYNKLIFYKGKVVLETTNWLSFTPRKDKKRGMPISNVKDVLIYLKKINKEK